MPTTDAVGIIADECTAASVYDICEGLEALHAKRTGFWRQWYRLPEDLCVLWDGQVGPLEVMLEAYFRKDHSGEGLHVSDIVIVGPNIAEDTPHRMEFRIRDGFIIVVQEGERSYIGGLIVDFLGEYVIDLAFPPTQGSP